MSTETYMKCSNRCEALGMNAHLNIQCSNGDEIGHIIINNVPNYPIFKKSFLNCHNAYWRKFVQKKIKMLSISFSLPAVNLFRWKTELMFMQDLLDFIEDEAFIIVQCLSVTQCVVLITLRWRKLSQGYQFSPQRWRYVHIVCKIPLSSFLLLHRSKFM